MTHGKGEPDRDQRRALFLGADRPPIEVLQLHRPAPLKTCTITAVR